MIGVGFFGITIGAVLVWAGYNDVDALATLDAILQKKAIPPHKNGEGLARIGRAALVILALKTTAGALGGLLGSAARGGSPGGAPGESLPGEGVPGEIPGELPIPEPIPVPINIPRIPPPVVTI